MRQKRREAIRQHKVLRDIGRDERVAKRIRTQESRTAKRILAQESKLKATQSTYDKRRIPKTRFDDGSVPKAKNALIKRKAELNGHRQSSERKTTIKSKGLFAAEQFQKVGEKWYCSATLEQLGPTNKCPECNGPVTTKKLTAHLRRAHKMQLILSAPPLRFRPIFRRSLLSLSGSVASETKPTSISIMSRSKILSIGPIKASSKMIDPSEGESPKQHSASPCDPRRFFIISLQLDGS